MSTVTRLLAGRVLGSLFDYRYEEGISLFPTVPRPALRPPTQRIAGALPGTQYVTLIH
jgi:hypothetical protein